MQTAESSFRAKLILHRRKLPGNFYFDAYNVSMSHSRRACGAVDYGKMGFIKAKKMQVNFYIVQKISAHVFGYALPKCITLPYLIGSYRQYRYTPFITAGNYMAA